MYSSPSHETGGPVVSAPVGPSPVEELPSPVVSGGRVVPGEVVPVVVVEEEEEEEEEELPDSEPGRPVLESPASPVEVDSVFEDVEVADGGSEKQAQASATPSSETTERQTTASP